MTEVAGTEYEMRVNVAKCLVECIGRRIVGEPNGIRGLTSSELSAYNAAMKLLTEIVK